MVNKVSSVTSIQRLSKRDKATLVKSKTDLKIQSLPNFKKLPIWFRMPMARVFRALNGLARCLVKFFLTQPFVKEIARELILDSIQSKSNAKTVWLERRKFLRKNAESELLNLAKELAKSQEYYPMQRGLPNPTASRCYMNSAIQSLESMLKYDSKLQQLLKRDLSSKPGESLFQLEKRRLKDWKPLKRERNETYRHLRARIEFKHSFLLVLQAKLYGNSKILERAANLHCNLCFAISLEENFHAEFNHGEFQQKDAASYLEMWYDILQTYSLKQQDTNHAKIASRNYQNGPVIQKLSLLQLSLVVEDETAGAKAESLLENYFANEELDHGDTPLIYKNELGEKVFASQSIRRKKLIDKVPKILAIHFKRYNKQLETLTKLRIEPFEQDKINFTSYFKSDFLQKNRATYDLTSFIVHEGTKSLNFGHYVAYVKQANGAWLRCADQFVENVKNVDLSKAKGLAYIAFFSRR